MGIFEERLLGTIEECCVGISVAISANAEGVWEILVVTPLVGKASDTRKG